MSDRVPDAWDDDFEEVADKQSTAAQKQPQQKPKASRAERRAQHAEANRALWNSADSNDGFQFVDALRRDDVPLKTEFKPAVTVLSRKPKPEVKIARPPAIQQGVGPDVNKIASGLASQDLSSNATAEDEDPDSEEEARREQERSFKTRQEKARVEREEKQRKYNEVRSRLFGAPDADVQAAISRTSTPSRESSGAGNARSRGGAGRGVGKGRGSNTQRSDGSSAEQSPARHLYDPEYSAKPGSTFLAHRASQGDGSRPTSAHIRSPRGPDSNGQGFAARGRGSKGNPDVPT